MVVVGQRGAREGWIITSAASRPDPAADKSEVTLGNPNFSADLCGAVEQLPHFWEHGVGSADVQQVGKVAANLNR